ncbi:MAG: alpha/beta fold hydrolase [Leptolyngbya sp. PLA1]|nr:alpha/beta fold hydrolase [Leptolyngbya sp. PLA1]
MLGLAGLLLVGLLTGVMLLIAYTAWVLSHPPRRTYAAALASGRAGDPGELTPPLPFTLFQFSSGKHRLDAWDVAGGDPRGPVLVFIHGWGDSRIGALSRIEALAPAASRLIAWDLPGHGDAPGLSAQGALEAGAVLDLLAELQHQAGADAPDGPPSIVLVGWSMGAGIALHAATEAPKRGLTVRGVIAEAPYRLPKTPARRMLISWGLPWRLNLAPALWFLGLARGIGPRWKGFDRREVAARLSCPLLVLHGEVDPISPPADGAAICEAGRGRLAVIPAGGHYGLWTTPAHRAAASAAALQFLASLGVPSGSIAREG